MNAEYRSLFLRVIDFLNGMTRIESGTIQTEYGMMQINNEWVTTHSGDIENMVELIQGCIDIDYKDENEVIPTMEKKDFEIYEEEEEEEAEEVVKQLPDGTIINCCDECPHCTRVKEAGIPFDDDDEDYYGMVGGCGMSAEVFHECFHPNNNEQLLDNFDILEMVDKTCPLEDAPENTPEEEDE